jgi:hypothetical protein
VDVVAEGAHGDVEQRCGLCVAVAVSVNEQHGHPLVVGQMRQGNVKPSVRLGHGVPRLLDRKDVPPTTPEIGSNRGLADAVQVAGRVLHRSQVVSMLPRPLERVSESFGSELDAVPSDDALESRGPIDSTNASKDSPTACTNLGKGPHPLRAARLGLVSPRSRGGAAGR